MYRLRPKCRLVALGLTLAYLALLPASSRAEPEPLSPAESIAVSMVAEYLHGGASALWPRVAPGSRFQAMGREQGEVEMSVRMGTTSGTRWTLAHMDRNSGRSAVFHVEYPSGIDDLVNFEVDVVTGNLLWVTTLAEPADTPGNRRMAPLANLRHLLTRGDVLLGSGDADSVEALFRSEDQSKAHDGQQGFEIAIRRVWLAQYRLLQADAETALEDLGTEARGSGDVDRSPLATLLRARIAGLQDDEVSAERLYRSLLSRFEVDVLRRELADLLFDAGDWTRGQSELQRLAGNGSRDAESYYDLARLLLFSHLGQAESAFRTAWRMQPHERSEVLEDPYFAHLLGSVNLYDLLRLGNAEEPVLGPSPGHRKAIVWPSGAELGISGEHLMAWVGKAILFVPGGAHLAPTVVKPSTARDLRRRLDAHSLAMVPRLRAALGNPAVLRSPSLLRDLEMAAQALANAAESTSGSRIETWRRLAELTEAVQTESQPPARLAALRVNALWQVGRKQEAVDLLAKLAADSQLVDQDPGPIFHLSRLCAEEGRADLAVRLLHRLRGAKSFAGLRRQIDRYELDERLDGDFETYRSVHFELRHDASLKAAEAVLLGGYLEAELERLREWIPIDEGGRIKVHLVPAADFYRVYGGGVGILGLFDGRIRLPVFEVGKQSAVMTGVLSHELAHAMIERATHDCAPKWLHEGLAQLVEPGARQINPYRSGVKPIAMPLLESILRGFSESRLVGLAYEEAYWTLRFIEHRHGHAGIHGLLDSFGECRQTPEALRQALGKSESEFDGELQAWAKGPEAPLEDKGLRLAFSDEQLRHMEEMAPGFGDVAQERSDARHSAPHVGLTREVKLPTREDIEDRFVEEATKIMVEWHSQYQRFATLIKQELAKVLAAVRGDSSMPPNELKRACDGLWTLTVSIQMGELETIDKEVTSSLRAAYAAIGQAAGACVRGRDMEPALKRADTSLKEAAYHLDKYGLKP